MTYGGNWVWLLPMRVRGFELSTWRMVGGSLDSSVMLPAVAMAGCWYLWDVGL